jgi:hypothetical protein
LYVTVLFQISLSSPNTNLIGRLRTTNMWGNEVIILVHSSSSSTSNFAISWGAPQLYFKILSSSKLPMLRE